MSHALPAAQIAALRPHSGMPILARLAVRFAVAVTEWDMRRTTRRHLKQISPHLLNDIGLDATTARSEAAKPFWQT